MHGLKHIKKMGRLLRRVTGLAGRQEREIDRLEKALAHVQKQFLECRRQLRVETQRADVNEWAARDLRRQLQGMLTGQPIAAHAACDEPAPEKDYGVPLLALDAKPSMEDMAGEMFTLVRENTDLRGQVDRLGGMVNMFQTPSRN